MKWFVFFMVLTAMLSVGCRNSNQNPAKNDVESVEKLLSIDEIAKAEEILSDSSLMNADGDKSWKRLGSNMVRIKYNNRYYLRMETEKGSVTSVTYKYDD